MNVDFLEENRLDSCGSDLDHLGKCLRRNRKLFHVEQFRVNGTALENFVASGFVLFGMHLRKIMPKCASCSEWGFLAVCADFRRSFSGQNIGFLSDRALRCFLP
jgi:hypothetical protein